MDADLANVITLFRRAQDCAVHILVNQLKIPRPTSIENWIFICESRGLYDETDFYLALHGYGIDAHGAGIFLCLPGLYIDFDWGANGEPDGFDTWRLWHFHEQNEIPLPYCDYTDLKNALIRAHAEGDIIQPHRHGLYYWPADRAQ